MNKNRGMLLEKIINKTIEFYEKNQIALFHKKNLDIVFRSINQKDSKKILNNAFLTKKSTVDYYGVYKGRFIAFEAKSVEIDSLPLQNIKTHQIEYLNKVIQHQGVAFLIILFKHRSEFFLLEPKFLENLDKKSLSYEEIKNIAYSLDLNYPGILDFVNVIDLLF